MLELQLCLEQTLMGCLKLDCIDYPAATKLQTCLIETEGNMWEMICLSQGRLCTPRASSSSIFFSIHIHIQQVSNYPFCIAFTNPHAHIVMQSNI